MVEVWLPYGNTEVCLRIPAENFLREVKPNDKEGVENPQEEIARALKEPVGTKRLTETVKPGDKVSIVLNGRRDPALSLLALNPVLRELNEAGVGNKDIVVIRGHDPLCIGASNSLEVGDGVSSKEIEVIVHNPEAAEDNVYVGETSRGTKVYLNKRFVESKVKVLTGFLEPHPYTGYSGGRDCVLPGVSGAETIQHNLSMVTDPAARPCLLEGNPVHEDMVEAARLAGVDFTLNIVRNSKLGVVKAFAGDLDGAFKEGVAFADEVCKFSLDEQADIVFVSPGGSPFDMSLYESHKSVVNALDAVKKNGVLVLVAECSGGYGDSAFSEWLTKFKDSKGLENSLKKRFTAGGYVAYSWMRTLERVKLILVSAIPDYYAFEVFKLKTARTVNEALRYALDATKKNAKVLTFSHGNLTVPVVRQ